MIMLDNTIVNVALPSIAARPRHRRISELEWVVAGYALTFAALMLTGGKLADMLRPAADLHHRARDLHAVVARVRARRRAPTC